MKRSCVFLAATALFLCVFGQSVYAQATVFTYQGRLLDNNLPPTATYDFEFALFDAETDGNQISGTISANGVQVRNGIFSVVLDYGNVFDGSPRFLEIRVRPAGGTTFAALAPRQPVTSAPYGIRALTAMTAETAVTANTANTATTATTADNANNLGGIPANLHIKEGDTRLTDTRDPNAGSTHYVQNQNAGTQNSTNFNIDGTGSANILNAATQFNISGNRVLSVPGNQNIFVGVASGFDNIGANNAFIGENAGRFNTTGSRNTFAGYAAGYNTTEGNENSFFGNFSGFANVTGTQNSTLGFGADLNGSNLSFATAIGSGSRVTTSNQVQLGRNGQDTVSVGKLADPSDTQVCINGTVLASCTPDHFVTTDDPRLSDERDPTEGSGFYIQNQNAGPQTSANFNISGNGVIGGTLSVGSSASKFALPAVTGISSGGRGVIGQSRDQEGVFAKSQLGNALRAESDFGTAIIAKSASGGTAIDVQSLTGQGMVIRSFLSGIDVESNSGIGIVVKSQSGAAGIDVDTQGTAVNAKGVMTGVRAEGNTYGVFAKSLSAGVRGEGTVYGVYGDSPTYGVYGSGTIAAGVYGTSDNFGVEGEGDIAGVRGSGSGIGVLGTGETGVSGTGAIGVYGTTDTPGGFAAKFEGHVQVTGTIFNPSDARLKKNIDPLGYGLKDLMQLHPVTWLWKNSADDHTQLGLIAQEVENVMPELVLTRKNTENNLEEMKALNYMGLIPVLINSVQEQQNEIEDLKARNAELETKNTELEKRLAVLEMTIRTLVEKHGSKPEKSGSEAR